MREQPQLVYVDTNIFLNSILYDPEVNIEANKSIKFLQKVTLNQVKAFTSVLTWDELVYIVKKEIDFATAYQKGQEFLNFPNLMFEKVSLDVIKKAQDLLYQYKFRPRDAIHLATAILKKSQDFITFESDFDDVSEIKIVKL